MDNAETAPVITTVISAYNRAGMIDRAIGSVLAQSLEGQPIVVVDDASTDETAAKARAYGDRVRLIVHDSNRGPGGAANTGLAAVETPFVAFLDSDDTWHPLFLERMLAALRADPTKVLAYCNFRLVYQDAGLDIPIDTRAEPTGPVDLIRASVAPTSATAGLTSAIRRLGGFQQKPRSAADFDLHIRIAIRYGSAFVRVTDRLMTSYFHNTNETGDYDHAVVEAIQILDKHLCHPALREARRDAGRIKSRFMLGIAGRKYIRDQVSGGSTRSVTLIVFGGMDAQAIATSLASAAAQALPPLEAAVLAPASRELEQVLAQDWPFRLTRLDTAAQDVWRPLRHVLAISNGELLGFLNAGDTWTDTALDRHRRAFSSSLDRVSFSYGGFASHRHPPAPLTSDAAPRICQMIEHWVPGSVSAMVVDRRALARLPNLALPADCPLWLGIASRITLEQPGVAVRLRDPAVAQGERGERDDRAVHELLTTLSETRAGLPVAALADRLEAYQATADPWSWLDDPEVSEPIW